MHGNRKRFREQVVNTNHSEEPENVRALELKALLAASVLLRLPRPPPLTRLQAESVRRIRSTPALTAAPGLLAHALVAKK